MQLEICLNSNQNIAICPCGAIMEVEQGFVEFFQKDDNGKEISAEAAVHLSKNRVRCGVCEQNFCKGC